MGLKDSLVSMMGEFVELRRNPEFRSKTELCSSADQQSEDSPNFPTPNRRHSLQITCGTQEVHPEQLVHQRTFSARSAGKDNATIVDSVSLRQRPSATLEQRRRYKQRRASEPLNLLGSLSGWARGSGHRKKVAAVNEAEDSAGTDEVEERGGDHLSPPPPPSPGALSGGGRSPAHSLSKSAQFARFYAQQPPAIEEAEELEAADTDTTGQRRQSHSKRTTPTMQQPEQQRQYTTVIRL